MHHNLGSTALLKFYTSFTTALVRILLETCEKAAVHWLLPVTYGYAVFYAGYSGFHHLQLVSSNLYIVRMYVMG